MTESYTVEEYQSEDGNIREYYPDFFVKTDSKTFFIVETKGREDLDDVRKIKRLSTWCKDINTVQKDYTIKGELKSFADVCKIFEVK